VPTKITRSKALAAHLRKRAVPRTRELTACWRTGRTLRLPRLRLRGRGKSFVTSEVTISERPVEAADRAVPGHR
jgi:hypothetical protein